MLNKVQVDMGQTNHTEAIVEEVHEEHEEEVEHIHMPPPSWAPIILALGMTGMAFGVALSPILIVVGTVLLLLGIGMWVYEEIKLASAADTEASEASNSSSGS
jgi:membrane-bound ClpP family serine protease